MFIKKDLRKIPRILADAAIDESSKSEEDGAEQIPKRVKQDFLKELKLARRKAEFNGSVKILCQPSNAPSLHKLVSISIYDCNIKSLEGIEFLGSSIEGRGICCPSLEILNIGRNPISNLPDELSMLGKSLKEFWCDDCKITGTLPKCVMELHQLETLHMANNQISDIPSAVVNLTKLRRLSLDQNQLRSIPSQLSELNYLESLLLRNNKLEQLPPNVPGPSMTKLKLLHVSSNLLTSLPESLISCSSLESIYANSNKLRSLPEQFGLHLPKLTRLNLCNNSIQSYDDDFIERFGRPNSTTGLCKKDDSCIVYIDAINVSYEHNSASSQTTVTATA